MIYREYRMREWCNKNRNPNRYLVVMTDYMSSKKQTLPSPKNTPLRFSGSTRPLKRTQLLSQTTWASSIPFWIEQRSRKSAWLISIYSCNNTMKIYRQKNSSRRSSLLWMMKENTIRTISLTFRIRRMCSREKWKIWESRADSWGKIRDTTGEK